MSKYVIPWWLSVGLRVYSNWSSDMPIVKVATIIGPVDPQCALCEERGHPNLGAP